VLSGDTIDNGLYFATNDCDKDDYSQNCVGGPANGTPAVGWQAHSKGQNVLFADGHSRWYKGYDTNEMTFRYDSLHGWE
jgi:prepilin-type processing-associated H-X9-DG protein